MKIIKKEKLLKKIVFYSENKIDNMTNKKQSEYLKELKKKLKDYNCDTPK